MHSRVVSNLGTGPATLTSPTAHHWPTCRTRCEGTPTTWASTTQPTDILHLRVASKPKRDLPHLPIYRWVADVVIRLIRLYHLPMSCRRCHTPHTTHHIDRWVAAPPTPPEEEAEHIRRVAAPLAAPSSSKDLNAFLTVYLRFLWQRRGLSRPLDLQPELTPLATIFQLPIGSSLSIIPVCVLSFSTAWSPASLTNPHSYRRLSPCGTSHKFLYLRSRSHAYCELSITRVIFLG